METRRYTIFHYHLEPGGVTTVIALAIEALVRGAGNVDAVDIVTGRAENTEVFLRKLRNKLGADAPPIRVNVHGAIDYLGETEGNGRNTETLASELIEDYAGGVWWIHNYQLGKNPLFTEAILRIADNHPEQRMILHIHDFPECSRYVNLAYLTRVVQRPVYPIAPNVRYAVINGRDRTYLIEAGIPESNVFLLNNPVDGKPLDRSKARDTRQRLKNYFTVDFPNFDPAAPLLLYPVRTIRRKNAFECALVSIASRTPTSLVITLPGVSELEKPYSDTVERAFRDGPVSGLFGIGNRLDDAGIGFLDLVASADIIVSSSIQEGFGFLYIDALLWGLPLLARRIDVLEGVFDVLDVAHAHLYEKVDVPVSGAQRKALLELYRGKIDALGNFLGDPIRGKLHADIEGRLSEETVDMSYLDVSSQTDVLKTAHRDAGYAASVRSINRELFSRLEQLLEMSPTVKPTTPDHRFTFDGFAETTETIVDSFGAGERRPGSGVQARLIERFARAEYMRLLYE